MSWLPLGQVMYAAQAGTQPAFSGWDAVNKRMVDAAGDVNDLVRGPGGVLDIGLGMDPSDMGKLQAMANGMMIDPGQTFARDVAANSANANRVAKGVNALGRGITAAGVGIGRRNAEERAYQRKLQMDELNFQQEKELAQFKDGLADEGGTNDKVMQRWLAQQEIKDRKAREALENQARGRRKVTERALKRYKKSGREEDLKTIRKQQEWFLNNNIPLDPSQPNMLGPIEDEFQAADVAEQAEIDAYNQVPPVEVVQDAPMSINDQIDEALSAPSQEEQDAEQAKDNFSRALYDLAKSYKRLEELKAIPSVKRGFIPNTIDSVQNSLGLVGSERAALLDNIRNAQINALAMMKEAAGLTGKMMDTPKEFERYMQILSNPGQSFEAVINSLDRVDKWLGNGTTIEGVFADNPDAERRMRERDVSAGDQEKLPVPEGEDPGEWEYMTPEERALWSQ